MKIIIGVLAILLPMLSLGQPVVKPLSVGDTLPDIEITNIYNYPVSSIHLSDLRGRLVILDFWSTWCGACIEAIPKMHRLQKEFGDRLQVILVDPFPYDDIKKVQSFFEKRKASTGQLVTLPYSLLQTSLPAYFPFTFIPHYVWIDKTGKIIATTSQTEVTAENIKRALEYSTGSLHNKKDLVNFSATLPLFVKGNGGNGDNFIFRSIFTKYIEGIGNTTGIERDDNGKITRFYMFNTPPLMLLRAAYPGELNCPLNRLKFESSNNILLNPGAAAGTLYYTNSFCYDLVIPPSGISQLQQYIRDDMKRYLGVMVKRESRKMNCLILRRSGSANKQGSRGGEPGMDINSFASRKYIRNEPFNVLTALLNNLPATRLIPVIDETGISGNIDMELPFDLYDLPVAALKSFLKKNGITAVEMERVIKVSVIKNK